MPAAWTTPADVVALAACADTDPATLDGPCALASAILFDLTGQQWPGPQIDVVRPCSPLRSLGRDPAAAYGWAYGWLGSAGAWCGCARTELCGCPSPSSIELPGSPATSVERVTVDAVVLAADQYRLSGQHLVRTDGGRWPCCQDWAVAGDQPGAFEVRYTWGAEPPEAGQHAAAVLACELAQAQAGGSGCRLPKRVTTVTRQGTTLAMLDPMAMFPDGQTGIPEVDLWLGSVRWAQVHRPSTVVVPGARARVVRDPNVPTVAP